MISVRNDHFAYPRERWPSGAGDAFGGAGAFGDLMYPIGAEAVEPAVALVWTSHAIRQFLETEPRVAFNAVQFVAGRLHDLQRRHRQLMTERVDRRVARALVRLVREAGRRVDAGVEIDFPVSVFSRPVRLATRAACLAFLRTGRDRRTESE